MRGLIKKALFGRELSQEYVCVPKDLSESPKLIDRATGMDISSSHLLLGYKPLLIGTTHDLGKNIELDVRHGDRKIAEIQMALSDELVPMKIYTGNAATLFTGNGWNRYWRNWRERRKDKGPGNIDLDKGLYQQVIAAYFLPRTISLIQVGDDGAMNEFPTDLHGRINEEKYVSSLRLDGKACQQVMEHGRLRLCRMALGEFRSVYSKGPNHNRELMKASMQVPAQTLEILELVVNDHVDIGLHRIFEYRIESNEVIDSDKAELAHCHREYLQWRLMNEISTEYLLR